MVAWPYLFAPLESDLTFEGDFPDFSLTVDNTADFSTNADWLTLNGTNQLLRINRGTAVQSEFVDFFQPGAGGILIGMQVDIPAPGTFAELLSAPSTVSTSVRGLGFRIQTDGDCSFIMDGNGSQELLRSTLAVADGDPHTVMLYLDANKNDAILFLDGQGIALNRSSVFLFLHNSRLDFSLPGSGTDFDILVGARQGSFQAGTPDRYMAGQVRRFLWINFGLNPPRQSQLIKMAAEFHVDGAPGEEFD